MSKYMNLSLDAYIETLYQAALAHCNEFVEMLYIQARSKIVKKDDDVSKEIDEKLIEDYLRPRGYSMNYILGKRVMVKNFTCVFVHSDSIEIWHDAPKCKSVFITESYLTNLPITLNYMERI